MAKRFVNLTLPVILEEIDAAFESELYRSQLDILNLPNLRQTLIEYTEKRLPIRYREVDEADNLAIVFRSTPSSLEEHLRVAAIVRQGIHYLIYRAEKAALSAIAPVVEGYLVTR